MLMNSFTVVIPSIGRNSLYELTIPSLVSQTVPPSQIIIIDDSNEGLVSVSRINEALHHGVFDFLVLDGGGAGAGAARMKSIDHSVCDYIIFLDDDDSLELDYIESLNTLTLSSPSDIYIPKVKKIWPQLKGISITTAHDNESNYILHRPMLSTFSGLTIQRLKAHETLDYSAFQDVIYLRKKFKEGCSVYYSSSLKVNFYQNLCASRMTSMYERRAKELKKDHIPEYFSSKEIEYIHMSAFFSDVRNYAYCNSVIKTHLYLISGKFGKKVFFSLAKSPFNSIKNYIFLVYILIVSRIQD